MEHIVAQTHHLLVKNKKTIAVAESCTGGLLSSLLTSISGSSKYFILGVIAYSNKAKEDILRLPAKVIAQKGAVSEDVALLLAKSVRLKAKTDFGVGITGIAGPSGGSKDKPVGTVFIAVGSKNKKICEKLTLHGSRSSIRKQSALKALELLKRLLARSS